MLMSQNIAWQVVSYTGRQHLYNKDRMAAIP